MYSINYYNLLSLKSRASLVTATVRVPHVCDSLRLAQFTYLSIHKMVTVARLATVAVTRFSVSISLF